MRGVALIAAVVAVTLLIVAAPVRADDGDYSYPGYPDMSNRPPDSASFCDRLAYTNGYNWTAAEGAHATLMEFIRRAYNGAAKNITYLPAVVEGVQGLLNNPNTYPYFDASVDYRANTRSPYHGTPTPNYRSTPSAALELDLKLAAFFGRSEAWACSGRSTDGLSYDEKYNYASIGSTEMGDVHAGMSVTDTMFAAFIGQFADAALSMSTTDYDFQQNVVPFLQSFARGAAPQDAICTAAGCSCATGLMGANCDQPIPSGPTITPGPGPQEPSMGAATGAPVATMGLIVAALATLLALRQ